MEEGRRDIGPEPAIESLTKGQLHVQTFRVHSTVREMDGLCQTEWEKY